MASASIIDSCISGRIERESHDAGPLTYERLMGRVERQGSDKVVGSGEQQDSSDNSSGALSNRLVTFRKWLEEADVQVHPSICIVNGEATDGTRNAPVLVVERKSDQAEAASGVTGNTNAGRVGAVDWEGDQKLYDRTMGCQVRSVREIKTDEVIMSMPRSAFITPDLVAASDAGRAVLACCLLPKDKTMGFTFWDMFENTSLCEGNFHQKLVRSSGPQLLVKVLQERKRVESAVSKRFKENGSSAGKAQYDLIPPGTLSTRAPLLAFLIQQRFTVAANPAVQSDSVETLQEFQRIIDTNDGNALRGTPGVIRPPGSPLTFAPYARTLPSYISIPLCWKRSELALLAASLPGVSPLLDAATRTLQLASEFIALLDAGLLERFPATFPPGLLTWERWVWASAIVSSRALPASAYIDASDDIVTFQPSDPLEFQSPPEIWKELGVLIPLLDMLNHESDAPQVTWEPGVRSGENGSGEDAHPPRATIHKKVKKGSELFCCYGHRTNSYLIQQYGFAQLNNPCDEVKLGWGLMDAVGHLEVPKDYTPLIPDESVRRFLVFDALDDDEISKWWTDERLALLGKEALKSDNGLLENLKTGMKMTGLAYSDGTFHPILLTVLVVATMPKIELQKFVSSKKETLVLSKRHQHVLRSYLAYFFTRKLEKLLQNICAGLKDHFKSVKLWPNITKGGLQYAPEEDDTEGYIGWQSFLDSHVYKTTMKVENHYYAMGAESCVLALYDGNLRALQVSLNTICDDDAFSDRILVQIEELGFGLAGEKDETSQSKDGVSPTAEKKSPKSRKRNKQKNANTVTCADPDRPLAVKLHVGNLSFATTPSDMYDYFSSLYGKDNILECHIPLERENGRSRGFGFVTVPEDVATRILESGQKHEMGGRLVKLARSNSAGTSISGRAQPELKSSDRCPSCGYRPKYCTCSKAGSESRRRGGSERGVRDGRPDDRDYSYERYRIERLWEESRYPHPPRPLDYDYDRVEHQERNRRGETDVRGYADGGYYGNSAGWHDAEWGHSPPRDWSPGSRHSSRRMEYDDLRAPRYGVERDFSRRRSRSKSPNRGRKRKSRRRSRSSSPK